MASVSGATSSLGNTSLRGFGGLASGIDRDEMIEAMTSGTQAKIDRQKGEMTKLQWKQEAYRNIIDKVLDIEDNYFSFTSGSNLKSTNFFAKNIVTALGDSDITKFIKASGTSSWVDNLAIKAVDQLAASATQMSGEKKMDDSVDAAKITSLSDEFTMSDLAGTKLEFGFEGTEGKFISKGTFTFPTSYTVTDEDGNRVTKDIDYTQPADKLVEELNTAIEKNEFKLGDKGTLKFELKEGKINISVSGTGSDDQYQIRTTSSALKALGYDTSGLSDEEKEAKVVSVEDFNKRTTDFADTYTTKNMADYLTGKTLSVTYGGQTKTIDLLKREDVTDEEGNPKPISDADFINLLQSRLDKAFGSGKIKVGFDGKDGALAFKNADTEHPDQTLTINSTDAQMRTIIGIEKNQSNKLSADASLWANREKLGFDANITEEKFNEKLADFEINGVKISGITKDTTLNELMNKINSSKDVGVKASYLKGSNQLLLVTTETGKGRQINLGASDSAASKIFGNVDENGKEQGFTDGKDATIHVSYGNGITQTLTSSTNTFDLEGMQVTVSGTFGYKEGATEEEIAAGTAFDSAQEVSFSAKANVDGVTEKVKAFFEAYNAMIDEVNKQVTTRPDRNYGPLTDAQKDEMDEKSIENWEEKAKQGILFNDAAVQNFGTALEGVMVNLMQNGISYADLKEIGISMSEDARDGGRINFDEEKFKAAMENKPELVSDIFTGGNGVQKGLASIVEDTLTPYATRYRSDNASVSGSAGSYGRLVEEAGSEKIPLSVSKNWIYQQLQDMEDTINTLKTRLKTEQDQYIKKFTTMETLISKFNSQSGYLSQLQG